ncbi:hypothetical protein ACIQUX_36630 [Streptomyces sp. NPDC101133]|uniref:hypothetical protein n=1 Tax=Streptomyces sp. NPDC101133 TaxID=3366111 RepID=UPI0038087BDF
MCFLFPSLERIALWLFARVRWACSSAASVRCSSGTRASPVSEHRADGRLEDDLAVLGLLQLPGDATPLQGLHVGPYNRAPDHFR